MQKDSEELPIETIYDVFEISFPTCQPVLMEVSPTPTSTGSTSSLKTTNITNPTSTKIGQMRKYQGEEKVK